MIAMQRWSLPVASPDHNRAWRGAFLVGASTHQATTPHPAPPSTLWRVNIKTKIILLSTHGRQQLINIYFIEEEWQCGGGHFFWLCCVGGVIKVRACTAFTDGLFLR